DAMMRRSPRTRPPDVPPPPSAGQVPAGLLGVHRAAFCTGVARIGKSWSSRVVQYMLFLLVGSAEFGSSGQRSLPPGTERNSSSVPMPTQNRLKGPDGFSSSLLLSWSPFSSPSSPADSPLLAQPGKSGGQSLDTEQDLGALLPGRCGAAPEIESL